MLTSTHRYVWMPCNLSQLLFEWIMKISYLSHMHTTKSEKKNSMKIRFIHVVDCEKRFGIFHSCVHIQKSICKCWFATHFIASTLSCFYLYKYFAVKMNEKLAQCFIVLGTRKRPNPFGNLIVYFAKGTDLWSVLRLPCGIHAWMIYGIGQLSIGWHGNMVIFSAAGHRRCEIPCERIEWICERTYFVYDYWTNYSQFIVECSIESTSYHTTCNFISSKRKHEGALCFNADVCYSTQ